MRSAMRATSQLPGRDPTDVDDAPASAFLSLGIYADKSLLWSQAIYEIDRSKDIFLVDLSIRK